MKRARSASCWAICFSSTALVNSLPNVLEGDVELAGALEQVGADAVGHGFALGDELGGVELGDDGFEDFVADGGEDALVVIHAEVLQSLISTLFYLTTNVALYVVLPLRVCMGYVPGKS
jgi:hypothetical protein